MSSSAQVNESVLKQYREASQRLSVAAPAQPVSEAEVRLVFGQVAEANPIAPSAVAEIRGGANMYGACSIQKFAPSTAPEICLIRIKMRKAGSIM
jgi:hypothetical protein